LLDDIVITKQQQQYMKSGVLSFEGRQSFKQDYEERSAEKSKDDGVEDDTTKAIKERQN